MVKSVLFAEGVLHADTMTALQRMEFQVQELHAVLHVCGPRGIRSAAAALQQACKLVEGSRACHSLHK